MKGISTILPIHRRKIPKNERVAYGRIVCNIRSQNVETYQVRLTTGSKLTIWNGSTSILIAIISTIKGQWNLVISTPKVK